MNSKLFAKKIIVVALLFCWIFSFGCGTNEVKVLDYSKAENWAYLPENANAKTDVFFLTPTVFQGDEDNNNMDVSESDIRTRFVGSINMEKGIYDHNTNFYAPYYQQISLSTYKLSKDEMKPYEDIAYDDVKASFKYYMDNYNKGHNIIIAGFSQGAEVGLKLLEEFFGEEKYKEKLVCAYLIGCAVTQDDLDKYKHLKTATGENDTGVIVSFNSESKETKTSILVPDKTKGINPLSWKTDSTVVSASLNKGACFTSYTGKIKKEVKGLCGAYLDKERGTLKITGIKEEDYPPGIDLFQSGVYHIYDYKFFYRNLQDNVQDRIKNMK